MRERWTAHIDAALFRAMLIIDEAREMHPAVLNELRLLSAAKLDASSLLTVVLCGDERLPDKFRARELLPLGSRIRVRCHLESASAEELSACLRHLLTEAGNPVLMTSELQQTLCERAVGNLRVMTNIAGELFDNALQHDIDQLDEKLYLELFSVPPVTGRAPNRSKA
ncbi:MAG: general secretion pathway protein GspA, partial [bacterium]|nr:general secretion pathway protein GspA [bacterium]